MNCFIKVVLYLLFCFKTVCFLFNFPRHVVSTDKKMTRNCLLWTSCHGYGDFDIIMVNINVKIYVTDYFSMHVCEISVHLEWAMYFTFLFGQRVCHSNE